MNSNAQNFTRVAGAMAEPVPTGKRTALDKQLEYQPCTARRVSAWGFSVPIRLRQLDAHRWEVPARDCHPGEHIELGPLPDGVTVRFEPLRLSPDYAPFLNLEGVLG